MSLAPSAGSLEEGAHRLPVRVYFEDTDASGIVYHAAFLRFFERGRTDFLRLLGISQGAELRAGAPRGFFAVRRLEVDYLKPAFLDDALVVSTRLAAAGGASVGLLQTIRRDDEAIAKASLKIALVAADGRPKRLSGELRDKMLPYLTAKAERGV